VVVVQILIGYLALIGLLLLFFPLPARVLHLAWCEREVEVEEEGRVSKVLCAVRPLLYEPAYRVGEGIFGK